MSMRKADATAATAVLLLPVPGVSVEQVAAGGRGCLVRYTNRD